MRAPPRRPRTPFLAGLALVALVPAASLAQDTPTQYLFTLKSVELCANITCTPAEVLPGTSDQIIDLGSAVATPGEQVATFVQGAEIASGFDFTHVRITFDRDFTVIADAAGGSGQQSTNGVDCNTTDGAVVQASSATQEVAIVNATEAVGEQIFVIPDTFAAPPGVTIDAGANTILFTGAFGQTFTTGPNFAIGVSFDVLNKIIFFPNGVDANNCDIRLGTPDIGISIFNTDE